MKLWKGRFQKEADPKTNDFNSSISIDSRMYREDIEGSIARASMLGNVGSSSRVRVRKICAGLRQIQEEPEKAARSPSIGRRGYPHLYRGELTARIGDAGKRLHTARSRNDQVALDVRLTLRGEFAGLKEPAEVPDPGPVRKGRAVQRKQ